MIVKFKNYWLREFWIKIFTFLCQPNELTICVITVTSPRHDNAIFTEYIRGLQPYYTYLLTPWCGVLLEKLTGLQLVKKFPAFHGIRRFITALTSVRHLSLSWTSPIQSIYPHPNSWRSILILSTHLRLGLPSGVFPSGFPTNSYTPPLLIHTRYNHIVPN